MTVMTRIPGRPDWAAGALYSKLLDTFPTYRTTLGVLDVQRLKADLGKSHEAIYKWLRSGKLTPDNARELVRVASIESNAAALAAANRDTPVFEDFCPFF